MSVFVHRTRTPAPWWLAGIMLGILGWWVPFLLLNLILWPFGARLSGAGWEAAVSGIVAAMSFSLILRPMDMRHRRYMEESQRRIAETRRRTAQAEQRTAEILRRTAEIEARWGGRL